MKKNHLFPFLPFGLSPFVGCSFNHRLLALFLFLLSLSCAATRPPKKEERHPPSTERISFIWSEDFPDSVSITLPLSSPLTGDICLFDSSVEQRIKFSYFEQKNPNILILQDCSASGREALPKSNRIIEAIASELSFRKIGLIRFAKDIAVISPLTSNREEFLAKLPKGKYPSPDGTEIKQAVGYAIGLLEKERSGERIILLFSDGNQRPDQDFTPELSRANETGVRLFVIGVGPTQTAILFPLATLSDGFFVETRSLVPELAARIIKNGIRRFVYIQYTPTNQDRGLHTVLIEQRDSTDRVVRKYVGSYIPPEVEQVAGAKPFSFQPSRFVIPFVERDNYEILRIAIPILDSIVALINSSPESILVECEFDGYTCDLGTDEHNLWLSEMRANSVKRYIEEHTSVGIVSVVHSWGEKFPLVENSDEESRRKNRRVEVKLSALR